MEMTLNKFVSFLFSGHVLHSAWTRLASSSLLRPGMRLMRWMGMSSKLCLMALLVLVPMLAVLGGSLHGKLQDLSVVRSERAGVAVGRQLSRLVNEVYLLHGLTRRVVAGDAAALPLREAALARLTRVVADADASLGDNPMLSLGGPWAVTRARILDLPDQPPSLHNEACEAVLHGLADMIQLNAERSRLLFDPDPASYFLMDLGVNKTPSWLEHIAVLYADGSDILLGAVGPVERAQMAMRLNDVERQIDRVRDGVDALARAGEPFPHHWEQSARQAREYVALGRGMFSGATAERHASVLYAKGAEAANSVLELNLEVYERLDAVLAQRAARYQKKVAFSLLACGLGGMMSSYLAVCFFLSFTGSLRRVLDNMVAVTRGDLSTSMLIEGQDELSRVGVQMEQMVQRMSRLVAEIRTSAVQVGQAGQGVAQESVSFAQRTSEQAQRLHDSVSVVTSLSDAVCANAQGAGALNELTDDLCRRIRGGGQAMEETVASMGMLEQSTLRVAEINGVIEDLAFQTNILALNATVEAARAGETGKGFAVVAAEVRQLAVRCSEAAAEIQSLVDQTTQRVGATKASLHDVNLTLGQMVCGIGTVSSRLKDIADSSLSQGEGLQAVIADVQRANDMTRENADWVERSADASKGLLGQSALLRKSVAGIQLRQGSADEAHALVERAIQYVHEVGWDVSAEEFRDPQGDWIDRDLYLFVFDHDGRYILHGARADFVGQLMRDAIGSAGEEFMRAAQGAIGGDPVWVQFMFPSPTTGELVPKTAFVASLTEEWLIAAAVYRSSSEA
jgi:methyl-accepting chemotaxis protein